LSAELPSAGSRLMFTLLFTAVISVTTVSDSVRSIASVGDVVKAFIRSGGTSFIVDKRAERGASVTGDERPPEKSDASSADMRRDERSSLRGGGARCREERDMAEGRRPSGTDVEGAVMITSTEAGCPLLGSEDMSTTGGRGARMEEGEDEDTDFERVRVDIAAVLAVSIRRSSRIISRSKTAMARSYLAMYCKRDRPRESERRLTNRASITSHS
jgi:hypothetical protein